MSHVVIVGVELEIKNFILGFISEGQGIVIDTAAQFTDFLDSPPDVEVACVIGGPEIQGVSPNEIAQNIQMLSSNIQQIYVTSQQDKFDTVQLSKDGFHLCSMFPLDQETLKEVVEELRSRKTGEKLFKSVLFADLEPNQKIDFDVYLFLPANKKYVKFVGKENKMSDSQYSRLTTQSYQKAHVVSSELSKFYEFTAKRLLALNQDPTASETEKRDRLRKSVRVIFSELFSSSEDLASLTGRKTILSNAKNIIQKFVEASGQDYIQKAITSQIGGTQTSYSHSTNVSVYASLFSLALGVGDPGNMAVAGLVHDLGQDMLPAALKNKKYEDMSPEEKKIFEKHPNESISLLKKLNLPLTDDVHKAVMQHHEKIDGTGFPNQVQGRFFCPEGQILAIANHFDRLTMQILGRKTMSPLEAISEIESMNAYSAEYISSLRILFSNQENPDNSKDDQKSKIA